MKQTGVLFDLDGTLLYTDELIKETFNYVFKKYKPGYNLSEEEQLSFLGPSLWETFAKYFDEDLIDEVVDYYRDFNHKKHKEYVYAYPTVKETLEKLKEKKFPLAIVTTKTKYAAELGLEVCGLTKYFDVVIGANEVTNHKPDPEGINLAMNLLNVDEAVMIGDNVSDIEAGKRAGIKTIAIKWSPKGYHHLAALQPDLMVDQMNEIIEYIDRVKG